MKIDGIGNAKRGIRNGVINRIVGLVLPFFIQTLTIRQLGIEYVGIKGLFGSILTVFSLAELGLGDAIVYSMYKPIAEDDNVILCALLNFYRKIYRIIGFVILILGMLTIPFLDRFIKGTYPEGLCIEVVFSLYLINTVLSYWLYAYRISLLCAYQRTDITSNANTVTRLITFGVQVFILFRLKSFYFFLLASIGSTIINNIIIKLTTDRMFPNIVCKGNIGKSELITIKEKVAGLLIGKICGTTRNTFDSIFISGFVGLIQTAIYSNYYYVLTVLNGFTGIILTSLLGGVGNSLVLNEKKKNYRDMIVLNNLYLVLGGIMSALMIGLYQPFMSLWMGENTLFDDYIMILFPIYFYISKMGDIRGVYADAAGLFWEDRYRCIIEAGANVLLNYFLGKYYGVLGILIATIITLFGIGFIGSTIVIFKYYFHEGKKEYLKNQVLLLIVAGGICCITYLVCEEVSPLHNVISLFVRALLALFISLVCYWGVFHKTKNYEEAIELVKRIISINK